MTLAIDRPYKKKYKKIHKSAQIYLLYDFLGETLYFNLQEEISVKQWQKLFIDFYMELYRILPKYELFREYFGKDIYAVLTMKIPGYLLVKKYYRLPFFFNLKKEWLFFQNTKKNWSRCRHAHPPCVPMHIRWQRRLSDDTFIQQIVGVRMPSREEI